MNTFSMPDDPRFHATRFLVQASSEETHGIWYRWSHIWGLDMEQDRTGQLIQIGDLAGRPIIADVRWYTVLGRPRRSATEANHCAHQLGRIAFTRSSRIAGTSSAARSPDRPRDAAGAPFRDGATESGDREASDPAAGGSGRAADG